MPKTNVTWSVAQLDRLYRHADHAIRIAMTATTTLAAITTTSRKRHSS
jgi:hypothetical protein